MDVQGLVLAFLSFIFISFLTEHVLSQDLPTALRSPDLVPCEKGWFYFREKCYKISGRKYGESWKGASDRCVAMGGHLVTIESEEENDFIISFLLLDIKRTAWIGLQDQQVESQYSWHDGSVSEYRKWRPNEPSGPRLQHDDCVEILFLPEEGVIGEWNDAICSNSWAYICQANITKRKISPDPRFCSPGVGGGWKFQQSCYNVIKEKKTWHEAEEHCKRNYNGGHLVTVLDTVVDKFLNYILSDLDEELWIGINIKDQFQQQWTSGWYFGYNGLSEDLRAFQEGYCVTRNKFKEWNVIECSKKLYFVCETSKTIPPVLPTPPTGSHCPEGIEGLRDLGGEYCYFVDIKNRLSWYQANYECGRRGGTLASIHSKEENEILGPFVRYSMYAVFIGMLRSLAEGEDFVWVDGTAMNFKNWDDNEPNLLDEKCGAYYPRFMKWHDHPCHYANGYICSIRKIGLSTSVPKSNHLQNILDVSDRKTGEISQCMYDVMVRCLLRH